MKHATWIVFAGLLVLAGCGSGPMPPELHEDLGYRHLSRPPSGPTNMVEELYSADGKTRYMWWWQELPDAGRRNWTCPTDLCRTEAGRVFALKGYESDALIDGKWVKVSH